MAYPTLDRMHFVNVGPGGTFRKSGELHTIPSDIDDLFDYLKNPPAGRIAPKVLAMYFHGGLVREELGARAADKMYRRLNREGGEGRDGVHVVSFIWETGFLETVIRKATEVNGSKLFDKFRRMLLKKVGRQLNAEPGGRGPGSEFTDSEINGELAKERPFEGYEARVAGGARGGNPAEISNFETEVQAEFELELEADPEIEQLYQQAAEERYLIKRSVRDEAEKQAGARGFSFVQFAWHLAKIASRMVSRYSKKREHGFYPTLMEEILRELYLDNFGEWTWSGMKDVAEKMWAPNSGPINESSHPGSYFLDHLENLQARPDSPVVDLIAHSAGSIAVCHLLRSLTERSKKVRIRKVIFLAPACRSDLFLPEIVLKERQFESFRIFTMSDELESQDMLVPGLYTRSLLYFISGVLEKDEYDCPIVGMQRYLHPGEPYGNDERLKKVREWIEEAGKSRISFSLNQTGVPGMGTTAREHGKFDDDDPTLESLEHLITAP